MKLSEDSIRQAFEKGPDNLIVFLVENIDEIIEFMEGNIKLWKKLCEEIKEKEPEFGAFLKPLLSEDNKETIKGKLLGYKTEETNAENDANDLANGSSNKFQEIIQLEYGNTPLAHSGEIGHSDWFKSATDSG